MRSALLALPIAALTTVAMAGVTSVAAAAPTTPKATGVSQKVIVILGNQHRALPATTTDLGKRRAAVSADQSPVRQQIGQLGGRTTKTYKTVNAVAATVPSGGIAALRGNPAVTAVVPDLPISMPAQPTSQKPVKGATGSASGQYCTTNPSKPQLEPEALELTHTNTDQGTDPTARSLGYTGAGVKVGFIADGTDIDQPDLIRADGSHVVTDYQDFSGDGTTSSTSGAEAMGDVGSIAAQGRTSYDLSTYVNPAHPLPDGCNIRIEGMAPGASVVALKVFSNNLLTAPTSTIVQAVDYAVNTAHVNVLNESFGANPYPDNGTDPISIANQDAIDAGVAVTASTGDSGTGNTLGTASTDPNVIAAGASTSERVYAQIDNYGFPLSNGKYTSDQVSGLSSGGISQTTRVQDLLAPGDLGWSLCSNRLLASGDPQYVGCGDYNTGAPSNIQPFGGTSEAAPLTAGAAALVIQAYRGGHGGATPTPAVVRTILTSSADDLGLPADEQGAGLLNSYRAVRLAHDYHAKNPTGQELSASIPQISNVTTPDKHVTNTVTLTNQGTGPQRVNASVRQVSHVSGRQVQSVAFDPTTAPTFLDGLGRPRAYVLKKFTVPVGTDRLDAAVSIAGDGTKYVRASLLDPQGTFTAYTLPQGTGNYAHIDVHQPAPGSWTAIVWSNAPDATSVSGPISLRTTYYKATTAGSVSPASVTIPQGGSHKFTFTTTAPSSEAAASSLVFAHRSGRTTTVPIVDRAVQRVGFGRPATFNGRFDQGNGRDFSPAQSFTYLVDVPSGARDLDVNVAITGVPYNQIIAHLSDPSGEPVSTGRNDLPGSATAAGPSYSGLQLVHANPRPGRYQLTLELQNQSSGAALPLKFGGSFALNGADVRGNLPTGHASVSKQHGATATVRITNTGPTPQTYFVDGRSNSQATYHLVARDVIGDAPDSSDPYSRTVALPLASDDVVPAWLVPTQVSKLTVGASATDPIAFDLMPLDSPTTLNAPNNPDTEAVTSGRSATAVHTAAEVGSTQWAAFPSPLGPVAAGGEPAGSVTMQAAVRARAFDDDVTSSSGDPLLGTVDAQAAAAHAITIPPGGHATITVHLTPHGAVGSRHSGTLFVDVAQPFGPQGFSTLTEEIAALPYAYKVGK